MIDWIAAHQLLCYLIFAGLVGSMPPLPPNAPWIAVWMTGFMHVLALNLQTAFKQLQNLNIKTNGGENGDKRTGS